MEDTRASRVTCNRPCGAWDPVLGSAVPDFKYEIKIASVSI